MLICFSAASGWTPDYIPLLPLICNYIVYTLVHVILFYFQFNMHSALHVSSYFKILFSIRSFLHVILNLYSYILAQRVSGIACLLSTILNVLAESPINIAIG